MFVAVRPDGATRELLASLSLPDAPGLRLIEPDHWHVTLRFLGDVDEHLVPRLIDALGSTARRAIDPVVCIMGPGTAWFAGGRVLQIPVAGLDGTAAAVRTATVPIVPDRGSGELPFVGHLTIARSTRGGGDTRVRAAFAGTPFASSFAVDALHLVGSHRTAQRLDYPTLWSGRLPA
jgi:2'-5' RNA ligase